MGKRGGRGAGKARRGRGGKRGSKGGGNGNGIVNTVSVSTSANCRFSSMSKALSKSKNPFPNLWRTTFTANIFGTIAASSGSTNRYDLFLNSLFQPFNGAVALPGIGSGGGATTQPEGFSGLLTSTGPYKLSRVLGSAVSLELLCANAGDNLVFTLVPTQSSNTKHANATLAGAAYLSVTRMAGFGQGGRCIIRNKASVAQVIGCKPEAVMVEDNYLANYNNSPTNILGWELWYSTCDGATNAGAIAYRVVMSFDAMLEGPAWASAPVEEVTTEDPRYFDDVKSLSSTSSSSSVKVQSKTPALRK
jgi:hypothetical protein